MSIKMITYDIKFSDGSITTQDFPEGCNVKKMMCQFADNRGMSVISITEMEQA